jgi:predicted ribosomally synthesized peptide with SipW-like signal peptide
MAKSKKIAIVVAAIALIAVIGVVGSTLAYFTDKDSKTNTFTMGNVNGTVEEKKDNGDTTPIDGTGITFDNVTPNATLGKVPYMKLGADSSDAYARIKLTWEYDNNYTDAQKANIEALTAGLNINPKWVLGTDGYYYYQDKIVKGQETAPIFTEVKIPETWGNEMANVTFKLKVEGDFIQADNFTPTSDGTNIVSWGDVKIEQFKAPETQQTQP